MEKNIDKLIELQEKNNRIINNVANKKIGDFFREPAYSTKEIIAGEICLLFAILTIVFYVLSVTGIIPIEIFIYYIGGIGCIVLGFLALAMALMTVDLIVDLLKNISKLKKDKMKGTKHD